MNAEYIRIWIRRKWMLDMEVEAAKMFLEIVTFGSSDGLYRKDP